MITDGDKTDEELFLELFLQHRRRIYAFILALVGNWTEAEDVFQRTAAVLWQKLDDFAPGTDFAAWALRVARFEALDHLKKRRHGRVVFSDEAVAAVAERMADRVEPEDARRAALERCLGRLAGPERELIRLRYQTGASAKEIADALGRSLPAVYKALDKVHARLVRCVRQTLAAEGLA